MRFPSAAALLLLFPVLAAAAPPPVSRDVEVAPGRTLHVTCAGAGRPVVVLEHGARADSGTWAAVLPEVARFTRVCAYDRPGRGQSSAINDQGGPRPWRTLVTDLFTLLDRLGEPGPYVLVGHSLGGLYVRLDAVEEPGRVAGLVLVDPVHEEMHGRLRGLISEADWLARDRERSDNIDRVNQVEVEARLAGVPLPQVPLVVITAAIRPGSRQGSDAAALDRLFRELHRKLADSVPRGRQVIAERSGHNVQREEPRLVAEAIHDVVRAVRRKLGRG